VIGISIGIHKVLASTPNAELLAWGLTLLVALFAWGGCLFLHLFMMGKGPWFAIVCVRFVLIVAIELKPYV